MRLNLSKKWEKTYIIVELILALIVLFYILFNNSNFDYGLLWLLPMSFLIIKALFYFSLVKINYNYGIVFIISNFIVFIRYIVTPFSMTALNSYNGMGFGINPSHLSINYAITFMMLELVAIYFFLTFAIVHYKRKQNKPELDKRETIYILKNKFLVIGFIFAFLPIILVLDPTSLLPKSISTIGETTYGASDSPFGGVLFIVVPIVRLIILFLGLSIFKKRYDKNQNGFYIILSWITVFLYLGMLVSTSRWIIIFSAIVCLIIMSQLFPKTPKLLYLILIAASVIIFSAISIYKYSWAIKYSLNPYRDIFIVLFGQFQEYFSGPRVVAQGIEMVDAYKSVISVSTLINDFAGSVPILSNFIDQFDRINVYFNSFLQVGNVTHIIPMISNGYAYFPLFPMVFSIISHLFMIQFDYKSQDTKHIEYKYLYAFMGLFFAMSMGFNTQIIFGNFLLYFFFPWSIFALNKKLTFSLTKK